MRKLKGRRPSPALLVAVVALVAALAGTAVGGVAVTSLSKGDKKRVKTIAAKQAKKQIKRRAPSLSVASAGTAVSAGSAPPFAYAKIDGATADVDAAFPSRNIASSQVSKAGSGLYCLNLSFTPATATAIPTGGDDAAMIGLAPQTSGCPAGTDVLVRLWDLGAGALQDESFLIQVSR